MTRRRVPLAASVAGLLQAPEEDLDLLLRLQVPGPSRHFEALRIRRLRLGQPSHPLERPAEAAVGCRVVRFEANGFRVSTTAASACPASR